MHVAQHTIIGIQSKRILYHNVVNRSSCHRHSCLMLLWYYSRATETRAALAPFAVRLHATVLVGTSIYLEHS